LFLYQIKKLKIVYYNGNKLKTN